METNETILTREVVAIDTHKRLGKVKAVCVDCDSRALNHIIVDSYSTHSALALPFEKTVALGDTFITIMGHDDLLPSGTPAARIAVDEGYTPVGKKVFSLSGNHLGIVKSFEFDAVYGNLTSIDLGEGTIFEADTFLFFDPEYIFVDDGAQTALALRGSKDETEEEPPAEATETAAEEIEAVVVEEEISEPESAEESAEEAKEESADTAELRNALKGSRLRESVTSEDGVFTAFKGAVIDDALLDEAEAHEALIDLTMAVDF